MTTTSVTANINCDIEPRTPTHVVRARPAGALHDVFSIAGRALRAVPRDLEAILPPVFIAFFFFIVNIGTLENLTQSNIQGFDYTAFEMATAVLLGVTGVSRAQSLVVDVQSGYFDRLLLTPVRRSAILVGHMVADVTVSSILCVPILALAFALGINFQTGAVGVLMFILIAALWSLSFAGFGYAIALKTGNPAAVNSSFLLFFPFLFLTSSYVPRDQLSGWLDTVAGWNPVTYLLEGLRSLALSGWRWDDIGKAFLALLVVFLISFGLCFAALRSRVNQR
jgi:ABC-2 type transport system permease protein